MKSFVAPTILAIASTSLAVVIPAHHANSTRPVTPFGYFVDRSVKQDFAKDDVSTKCVNVQSTIDTWYYTFSGPWGSETGQGPNSIGSFCVTTDDEAGGAIFIGPDPNPGPGSTKFECYFPTSGQANCDVSLVDGYSLSWACNADGNSNTIGGGIDLYQTGDPCPDQQGPNCINQNGYASSQSDVDNFFQQGIQNGNNYCIWQYCSQDYYFDISADLTCTVSGVGAPQ